MAESLAELLGIDPNTEKPNAYQIFGLQAGESDPERIEQAIGGVVRRLKENQAATEPALWSRAATAVTKARRLLIDPESRAAYDAKLRQSRKRRSAPISEADSDPLAGLLPKSDPLAPFDIEAAAARSAGLRPRQPPPLPTSVHSIDDTPEFADALTDTVDPDDQEPGGSGLGMAGLSDPAVEPAQVESPQAESPAVESIQFDPTVSMLQAGTANPSSGDNGNAGSGGDMAFAQLASAPKSSVRRRRTSRAPMILLSAVVLLMLGGIGGAAYYLVERESQLTTQPQVAQAAAPVPRDRPRAQPSDSIMGSMGPRKSTKPPADLAPFETSNQPMPSAMPMAAGNGMGAGMETPSQPDMQEPSMPMQPEVTPDLSVASLPKPPMPTPTPPPAPPAPSDAEIKQGDAALLAAQNAFLKRNWLQVKPLAENAQRQAKTAAQIAAADKWFEVAEMADYYLGGIKKALGDLKSGNTLQLAPTLEVAISEVSQDHLKLQVNGRIKRYTFEEIPLLVLHQLEKMTMSAGEPAAPVARAVYQYWTPVSKPADREEALEQLRAMPDEVGGVHPHEIADTLQALPAATPSS
ncbi:hypothetical protein FF011L_36850 [Roseimaritima multifibrata]|uniref:Uncharacterized protein n=1 Tax=Roseimaritima multifibrata TaxID=1930274 RepID=A0A517MJ34_9BACT|nr:hypothetical protein [Roseimaritima multifibrata]QDS94902.1 hypothetical protein FF011L_36850 [Roseimaritima multifibrata]